jgi:DNA-binding NarL/FixJ family response regulator
MQKKIVTIVVADKHPVYTHGMSHILEAQKWKVVGITDNGRELVRLVESLNPTVAIFDTDLPKLGGIHAGFQILRSDAPTRICFLTAFHDDHSIEDMYRIGAHGVVFKSSPCTTIITAVKAVASGETWFEKRVAEIIALNRHIPGWGTVNPCRLSAKEIEIAQLAAEGMNEREIGGEIGISHRTVEKHIDNIYRKLGIRTRLDLYKYACNAGIVRDKVA